MRPSMPKVSVVIPVYNSQNYLEECLNSVINQTESDIQIICIEDCSTDRSMEILQDFANKDNRIEIYANSKNSGLSASRNVGISKAKAPYIVFLDSDDYLAVDACEKLFQAVDFFNADVAVCNVKVQYDEPVGDPVADRDYFTNRLEGLFAVNSRVLFQLKNASTQGKIFRTEIIRKNDILFPCGLKYESYPFWGEYCSVAKRIIFINDFLFVYRRHSSGIMGGAFSGKSSSGDYVKSIVCYYDWLKEKKLFDRFSWYFWRLFWFCLLSAWYMAKDGDDRWQSSQFAKKFIDSLPQAEKPKGFLAKRFHKLLTKEEPFINKEFFGFRFKSNISQTSFSFLSRTIARVNYSEAVTSLRVLRIPVFRIHRTERRTTCFLLKVPFFVRYKCSTQKLIDFVEILKKYAPGDKLKKYINRVFYEEFSHTKIRFDLDSSHLLTQQIDDTNLLKVLRGLGHFTYIPNAGNMGDGLIAKSTYDFFERNHLDYEQYTSGFPEILVYGGGGIWVKDHYKIAYEPILNLMDNAKKVVILPSSIYECEDLIKRLDSRYVVFCREKMTYDYLLKQGTKAQIYLDHDMALRLKESAFQGEGDLSLGSRRSLYGMHSRLPKIGSMLVALRSDVESNLSLPTDFDISSAFFSRRMTKSESCYAAALILSSVDQYDCVVTDRLHVGIAASLMGKQVFLLDNNYGKLSGVYRQSLSHMANVNLCDKLPVNYKATIQTASDNFEKLFTLASK